MRIVRRQAHFADVSDRMERRPAATRIELVLGREELLVTDHTDIVAVVVQSQVLAGEWPVEKILEG